MDTLPCTPFDLNSIDDHMKAMFPDDGSTTQNNRPRSQDEVHDRNEHSIEPPTKIPRINNNSYDSEAFDDIVNRVNAVKFNSEQHLKLNALRGHYADTEKENKYLKERLQTMTSKLIQLEKNASKTKEINTYLAFLKASLSTEIQKVSKILPEVKKDHENQMSTLTETHNKIIAEKQIKIDDLMSQLDTIEKRMAEFKRKIKNISMLTEERDKIIASQKNQIQNIRTECSNAKRALMVKAKEKEAILIENHKKSSEQLRENLQTGHLKAMKKFDDKLRTEHAKEIEFLKNKHDIELDKLRKQHKKDLEDVKEQTSNDLQNKLKAFMANING